MRVLVACEFSGRVRDAFLARGHDSYSCDLLPTDVPGPHYQCDVMDVIDMGWDLMIAHPPCTYLAVSGARWFSQRIEQQKKALLFVSALMDCGIPKWCIENPKSVISTRIRKPDQIIQPWQFGERECKETHLWLNGLMPLQPTRIVSYPRSVCHRMGPSPDRSKMRSMTYRGIAEAMASQWG